MENKPAIRNTQVGAHMPADDFGNLRVISSIPRCYIGQNSNVSGYAPGKFNFEKSLEWEPTPELKGVILIKPNQGFVLFGETFKSPSRCGSSDGIRPDARYTEPISSECGPCPMHRWDNTLTPEELAFKQNIQKSLKRTKIDEKPDCSEKIELLLVDDRRIPFVLTGLKTQINVIQKNLINVLRYKSRGKRIFETQFDMSLVPGDPNKGNYVSLKFDNFHDVNDPALVAELTEMSDQYANFSEVMKKQNEDLDKSRMREVGDEEIPFDKF